MWPVQLCLALLLGMLGPLASAPRLRGQRGGWYAWSGVLLAAWMTGVSGILAQRFPDWAVLYLFEAMGPSRNLVVLVGVLGSLLAAFLGKTLVVPLLSRGRIGPVLLWVALVSAVGLALTVLVRDRLVVVATTFEFQHGLARPFSRVIGFQGLFALVVIGVTVPCVGTLLLLVVDSLRMRPRGTAH